MLRTKNLINCFSATDLVLCWLDVVVDQFLECCRQESDLTKNTYATESHIDSVTKTGFQTVDLRFIKPHPEKYIETGLIDIDHIIEFGEAGRGKDDQNDKVINTIFGGGFS